MAGVLLIPAGGMKAASINARSASLSDVSAAVFLAKDGDTVTVPAGSATWSNKLVISKGITLRGETTVDSTIGGLPASSPYPGAGYSAANDKTIITRDNLNGGVAIVIQAVKGKTFRLSGLTFAAGTSQSGTGILNIQGTATDDPGVTGHGVRIDNCHFTRGHSTDIIHTFGCVFGVIDHCLLDLPGAGRVTADVGLARIICRTNGGRRELRGLTVKVPGRMTLTGGASNFYSLKIAFLMD